MSKPKIKHTITKKEWNKKHKDFKLMGRDGIPYIIAYDSKIGTHLVPVKIIEATDAEEKEFHTKLDTLVHNTFGKSPEEMEESVGAELDLIKQSSKDVRDFIKKVFSNSDFRDMKSDKDFLKYLKSIYEGINEMGINDPIMIKLRAAQMRKNKEAAKKIDTEKQNKNVIKIKALKKKRAEVMRDMEQEAEPEGGKIADRYGKLLNRIDNDIIKLGGNPMSESVNEAYVVMYAKKKGEKPAAAAFQLRGSALSFEKDLKKDGYITMVTQKKVKGIDESVNEAKVNYNFSEDELKRVLKLLGRNASTEVKMIKAFEKAFGRKLTRDEMFESVNEGKFQKDDLVYNTKTKTVGIVRMGDDKYGEVKTDADGNVDVDELEKYNPIKFKHQTKAKVAPSTEKEVSKRGLFNPFKNESVNESKEEVNPQQLSKIQSDIRKINSKIKVYISKHPMTKGELSIELGAGHNDDSEIQKIYKVLKKHTGDWRTGTMFNESVNESNDVYHKSYTHAIEAAEVYAKKKGYEIEDDEMFTKVGMNSKRPSVGKTTRVSLELLKNGKPQRKMLHIQVYGMKNGYELNAYIN